jgi:putative endonuclease
MFTVYVLYNILAKKSYTGQTDNINRRLLEHNNHSLGGFTSRYRGEWVLIYTESVTTRSEALMREKQLKSGNGRAYIKQYIPG